MIFKKSTLLMLYSVGRQILKIQVLPEYLPAKTTQVPTWPDTQFQVLTWADLGQVLRYLNTSSGDVTVIFATVATTVENSNLNAVPAP